ncbi:PAS domain-containing protein [Schlegelella sp. S2-27]|uniref:PAS domain-containing protein n=1 Tax=Caldimonas mangrovi TaxID=2944811 RepID=A0ABT0YIN0_9BURK|nr:chemotaxis protein CheB [Caldimonas mangrovi]MCM5678244.1 PAS domain-containing protein [Caldimonas mangrovi]
MTLAALPGTRVVGLGASAGGLDPLTRFFTHAPIDLGVAFVVVQHMDPKQKSMLGELLQKVTAMPVREASDAQSIEPNVVYVIPPAAELSISGNHLRVSTRPSGAHRQLPIDALFDSLARERGHQAVGIVLSGMGSDGTLGLRAIKKHGGLALVQQPESSQYDSMPSSALAAGHADFVAPPEQLPAILARALADKAGLRGTHTLDDHPQDAMALRSILALLRARTRHDFSLYKSSTLIRRIERRMAVHGLAGIDAYAGFLRQNPAEVDLLFSEVLIGVTRFFRDPPVWQELEDSALPELLARRTSAQEPLRAWVVGCSTGEEAYSLAMVFKQVTEGTAGAAGRTLQIFASDLSADAIAAARKGHYPASITADVGPERLARFFTAQAGGYTVDKRIREMVLFARHDVSRDPPFTKLDILCCRNLMIYFNATLQQHLVPLFHYGLRPGGLLVLGSSETVGRSHALFTPTHPKSRLYWRQDNRANASQLHFHSRRPLSAPAEETTTVSHPMSSSVNLQTHADQVLLKAFTPAAVLVTAGGDIVYIHGHTGKYLEPAAGKANWNIHVMTRPSIRAQLGVALQNALQSRMPVELRSLRLGEEPDGAVVDIAVQPLLEPKPLEGMVMVVFRDVPTPANGKKSRRKSTSSADPVTAAELARAHDEIRALRQEMLTSREELQAANEELQSTNEELQSANEELTTSKEEAQSMNEELQTINSELQSKLDDLALAQSDMQNLLNSTNIATLFLDNHLNVRRFTNEVTRVIHLRETDVGRPLSDLATTLLYPDLIADAQKTLQTLAFSQKDAATTDGRWYSVRIMPYRTLANVIQGTVITLVDITTAKELEARLRKE